MDEQNTQGEAVPEEAAAQVEEVKEAPATEASSDSGAVEGEAQGPELFVMPVGFVWATYSGDADVFVPSFEDVRYPMRKGVPTPVPAGLYTQFKSHWLYADYLTSQE